MMPLRLLALLLLLPASGAAFGQTPDTVMTGRYHAFTTSGQPATLADIEAAMAGADVVLIGEEHDDPVAHALQAALLSRAFARYGSARPVALSLEMFERDVQYIVDEYLTGLITETHFLASSRPWPNYATDYRPMVEFARAHRLPVVAANAPRRYVNRVTRLGPDSLGALSARAKAALAPLPYAAPSEAYRARWDRLMTRMQAPHAASSDSSRAAAPPARRTGPSFLLESQTLWDATMAFSMAEHLEAHPGALVLHMVGGFHMESGTGIAEHLRLYRPGTRVLAVALRAEADFGRFDAARHTGLADFVVLTDASLPRTR